MVAAEGRTVGFFDRGKILAVQQDRAGGWLVKPGQNVQKRRLAGAGFAHDGDILAALHSKCDIRERLHAAAAEPRGVYLFQSIDFQNSHK